jgi:hypothetical protein
MDTLVGKPPGILFARMPDLDGNDVSRCQQRPGTLAILAEISSIG